MIARIFFIEPHYAIHWNETTGKCRIISTSVVKRGREITQRLHEGYLAVKVNNKTVKVHQIVGDYLFGPRKKGYAVNHIDGNKLNNSRANLEYITQSENIRHAISIGRHVSCDPTRMPTYKDGRTMGRKNEYKREWYEKKKRRLAA